MSLPNTKVDIKSCAKVEKIHPCDPVLPCDPYFQGVDCPTPYICSERVKNPAYPGEITTCKSGNYMHVKSCAKVEPPHPCDPLKPCSEIKHEDHPKKPQCKEPPLCSQRIKNPEGTIKTEPCDPKK